MGSTGYAEKTIIFRGASMKNLKKKVHFRIKLKSKHLLVIMSIFCVSCIAATFSSGVTTAPLQDAAGILIVPFENSINRISSVLKGMQDRMRDKEEILSENENLKAQIDSLTEQNNKLIQDQTEYVRLQQMYNLDQQYTEYPKIAAEIISKDPGNWYDTFMINRGSADGIRVDNNVLADKGLVGIVTDLKLAVGRILYLISVIIYFRPAYFCTALSGRNIYGRSLQIYFFHSDFVLVLFSIVISYISIICSGIRCNKHITGCHTEIFFLYRWPERR